MMPHPCPRMSSLIRPFAGVPACTGFEGPMLFGRGISGASDDKGREVPKSQTTVNDSVHHLPPLFEHEKGMSREGSSKSISSRQPGSRC
jgi:hypothetical protein